MPPPSTACVRTGSATCWPNRRQNHCETAPLLGADTLLVPYSEPERVAFAGRIQRIPERTDHFFHKGEDEKKLLDRLHPDAILTKESGESGYFKEKVEAAQACGIPVYVIQHPPLPDSFTFVQGLEGLRKAIERLAPGFFPLRSGFTTGACATAAAKAALVALLSQTVQTTSCITLPSGERSHSLSPLPNGWITPPCAQL